jgi:hypothetical protein
MLMLLIGFICGLILAAIVAVVIAAGKSAPNQTATNSETVSAVTTANPRDSDWRTFITTYEYPTGVIERALARCPQGTDPIDLERGLRQFFLACGSVDDLAAAMPSKTVDEAWHEFLTYTRDYAEFSKRAFGRMLHHVPEVTMTSDELDTNHSLGMLTAWVAACEDEGIPVFGQSAPTLFAADTRAVKKTRLRKRPTPLSPTYIGFCGTNPADAPTTNTCAAPEGTVCMRHAYAPDWRTLGSIVEKSTEPTSRRAKAYTSTSDTSTSGYDSVMLAALIPVLMPPAEDLTPVYTPDTSSSCGSSSSSSSSVSSCGSSSSSSSYSSCGSSSSSCGSSSSSCGGGGCGGGS